MATIGIRSGEIRSGTVRELVAATTVVRTVPLTAVLSRADVARTVPMVAQLSYSNLTTIARSVPMTAALSLADVKRTVPLVAAIGATPPVRTVPLTAAFSLLDIRHTVPFLAALKLVDIGRTVPMTAIFVVEALDIPIASHAVWDRTYVPGPERAIDPIARPQNANLTITRGDTFIHPLLILQANDEPFDLTNATVWLTIKAIDDRSLDDSTAVAKLYWVYGGGSNGIAVPFAPYGTINVELPATITEGMASSLNPTYRYDVQVRNAFRVYTPIKGLVTVEQDTTVRLTVP